MARSHIPIPALSTQEITRFNARVLKGSVDECWPWQGIRCRSGYGAIKIRRRMMTTHRIAYAIHRQDPGQLFVCHRCDNPPCCNPAHLFLGTNRDNQIDARNKGKLNPSRGDNHFTKTHPEKVAKGPRAGRNSKPESFQHLLGEGHHCARLTVDTVKEIREVYAEGFDTMTKLGQRYSVSSSSIWAIIHKKNWKHI